MTGCAVPPGTEAWLAEGWAWADARLALAHGLALPLSGDDLVRYRRQWGRFLAQWVADNPPPEVGRG